MTNRGSVYRLDKCMQSIGVLLKSSKSEEFFNCNDIDIIVDIGLRELGEPNTARARVQTLRVLLTVLDHESFMEHYKHRVEDYN